MSDFHCHTHLKLFFKQARSSTDRKWYFWRC